MKTKLGIACVAVALLAVGTRADDEPRLDLNLLFSTDGGQNWSGDFPMLEQPGVLKLRVTWANPRPAGETDIYTTALWSDQTDFASANAGHRDRAGIPAWHQRPPKSYAGARATAFDYTLDLRARPDGIQGVNNVRDPKSGAISSGPLPACAALSNGTYKFTVTVGYPLKLAVPPRRVEGVAEFFVSIGQPPETMTRPAPAKRPSPAPDAAFDTPAIELGTPDFVFDAAAADVDDDRPVLDLDGTPYRRLSGDARARWRLQAVPPGPYYIGLVLSSHPGGFATPRCYVDGNPLTFDSTRKPGQAGSHWVAEYLTAEPVTLAPDSELRVHPLARPDATLVGRLALYRAPQERGNIDARAPAYRVEDKLRLAGAIVWTNRGSLATARYAVTNVLPRPVAVTLNATVLDYYQQVAGGRTTTVTLQPGQGHEEALPFAWGDSQRYRLVLKASAPGGVAAQTDVDAVADAAQPMRGILWLSEKMWDFTGLGAAVQLVPPAPDADWIPAWVPGRSPNSVDRKEPCGWFRTTFDVPEWMAGTRRSLEIQRALYEATVVLNGREIGRHMGWQSGFEIDVTDALRPGTNVLCIGIRDGMAALTPEEQARGEVFAGGRKYDWPGPSDRAGLGNVRLISRPAQGIGAVTVRTSYRKRQLVVLTELDPQAAAAGGTLRHTVFFEGREVLACPPVAVATGTVRVVQTWADPILWGVRTPNLLRLDTELVDKEGRRVDLARTRFGFRELWPEGRRLMLNGTPINFRAFAMNDDSRSTERMQMADIRNRAKIAHQVGGMMERHITSWDNHFDVADEEGLLVARSVTGEAGATQWKLESDILWRNTETLAAEAARFFVNHPSIVEWYISNEYSEASSDADLATRRLAGVARAVKAADPTRIVEAGCDLDLRGALDIISTHYPVDIGGLRDRGTYLPDSALWYPRGQSLTNGMRVPAGLCKRVANVHGESPFAWGLKPILINETGWNVFYAPPFGFTTLAGDEVFRSPEMAERLHVEANRWFMAGHRDAEAAVITPWHHHVSGAIARVLPPLDIFSFSRITQWYSGTDVSWTVNLFHDTGAPETLTFNWALEDQDGRVLRCGGRRIDFPAYGLTAERVDFRAPKTFLARTLHARLRFDLTDESGIVRAKNEFPAAIHAPRKADIAETARAGLYDPDGKSGTALLRLGVETQPVTLLTPENLGALTLLIIGEQAAAGITSPAARQAILAFVEQGGALFCLRQDDIEPGWLPVGRPVAGQVAGSVFIRAPHHPALAGFKADDLTYWYPDHVVARAAYPKPTGGNTITLLDCGNAMTGLDLAVVQETRLGAGRVVCSQLMFADRAGTCPPADRLVAHVLSYLAAPAPANPAPPVLALVESGSPLDTALTRLGAGVRRAHTPGQLKAGARAVIAEAAFAWDQPWTDGLASFLAEGGTVLLHGAGPAHRELVEALSGRSIRMTDPTAQGFAGRMILLPRDPVVDGLNSQDFFWRRQPETENYGATYTDGDYLVENLAVCAYEGDGVEPLGYPAALARIRAGRGMLILDGVRWDAAGPGIRRYADRIAAALLGNLGVTFTPKAAPGRLTGLTYTPIDLRPHLNRALADDVAEDGKGGWTDQGADADMRALPTGRQVMAGVPFEIATPLSCLVLASKYRPAGAPAAVSGIRVGQRADALYFLQSSAWTGRGLHATYRIHYADGTTADILLQGGINYRDWATSNFADPFALESGTFTQVGWTGACKQFPQVSVYVMEWRNPRPETPITSFDFISANNGVPVLLAVSAGAKPPAFTATRGDAARAAKLDEEARAAGQAGDSSRALELSRQAVAADPTYLPARVRLGDLLEERGQLAEAEAEFRRVVELQPDHLETYLRIGKICETQKRWDDALAVYRRSLEVNVNQPSVMQALERVKPLATP